MLLLIKTGRLEQNKHNTSKMKETGGESNIIMCSFSANTST